MSARQQFGLTRKDYPQAAVHRHYWHLYAAATEQRAAPLQPMGSRNIRIVVHTLYRWAQKDIVRKVHFSLMLKDITMKDEGGGKKEE